MVGSKDKEEIVWCMVKGSENQRQSWQVCPKCCSFCNLKSCPLPIGLSPPCTKMEESSCLWRCTSGEWVLSKVDEGAFERIYQSHKVRYFEKRGFRAEDDTWEGEVIRYLRKKYGKDFGREVSST